MPNIIQILPAGSQNNAVYGILGLEEGGRLFYGILEYAKPMPKDGGPTGIMWRPLVDR